MTESVGMIRLYPKTEEQKEHFRIHGVPDKEGRFYRTGLDLRKIGTSKRKIIAYAIDTLNRHCIGSFYEGGNFLITKINEDEFEIKGHLDQKYLPEGIKFRFIEDQQ